MAQRVRAAPLAFERRVLTGTSSAIVLDSVIPSNHSSVLNHYLELIKLQITPK